MARYLLVRNFLPKSSLPRFYQSSMVCRASIFPIMKLIPTVIKIIPPEVVQKYQLLPVNRAGATLIIAVSDPSNLFAIEDIKFMTGYNIEMVVASERDIKASIDKYYDQSASLADVMSDLDVEDFEIVGDEEQVDVGSLERATEDAPVVKMVNAILQDPK